MIEKLRTGELTKIMNLIVKADLELREEDIEFLKFCRELGWGKLTGILIKDGVPKMADEVRHDVRFDVGCQAVFRPQDSELTKQLLAQVKALLDRLETGREET